MGLRTATEFIQRTAGLNTVLDPERLQVGTRTNGYEVEFAEAVNVSIDERGLTSLRPGSVEEQVGSFHSLFCKGGDCLVVKENGSDASIYKILTDYSLSSVATGLTSGLRMAWDQVGEDIFYSNGVDKGYIRLGVRYAWPVHEYNGPEADMQFATSIPSVSHIAFLDGGRILISVGNAIFQNHLPYQYGLFSPGKGNVASFANDVTMIAAASGGFFASDGVSTWFFRKTEDWYQYRQELAEPAGALEWSLAHDKVQLSRIGLDLAGFGRVWASAKGICVGTDDGQCLNLTKDKVVYPDGYTSGACLIKKDLTVIHTAW